MIYIMIYSDKTMIIMICNDLNLKNLQLMFHIFSDTYKL